MAIQNDIDVELWQSIQKNYESENYSGAIVDAILRLTETIRNKTGLEGDGASLIGQAFGGTNPKIKVNKLQTDAEKDVQKGIQEILRGLYSAIRNPRSHDAVKDKQKDADAIIIFVNYLLTVIDQSKLSFEEPEFLKRVFDKYYVKTAEYSQSLVAEIPVRQRTNIAIATILERKRGNTDALKCFMAALLETLNDIGIERVCQVISSELKLITDMSDMGNIINMFPGKLWSRLDKIVRLRIESILLNDFINSDYVSDFGVCIKHGALATFVSQEQLENFHNKEEWTLYTVIKLKGNDSSQVEYINESFWNKICYINRQSIMPALKRYLADGLKNKEDSIIERLTLEIIYDEDHPWWQVFSEELKGHPDIQYEELPF